MKTTLMFLLIMGVPLWALEPQLIALGESKFISAKTVKSDIRVSSRTVLRVQDLGDRLQITGRKVGRAVVSWPGASFEFIVTNAKTIAAYQHLRPLIEQKMGLSLTIVDDKVLIDGELLRLSDFKDIIDYMNDYRGHWRWNCSVDRMVQEPLNNWLSDNLDALRNEYVRLEFEPHVHLLATSNYRDWIDDSSTLSRLGLQLTVRKQSFDREPAIRLNLTLAEIQKSSGARLGANFEDGQSVQLLPKFRAPQELMATLSWMANQGSAHILASPTLVARNKESAEFQSGGEFAVKSGGYKSREVTWKRHGLILKFKPIVNSQNEVRLIITAELSQPDLANAVDGIPALKINRVNTSLDMKLGQTALLTGLSQKISGLTATGPQGVKDIPVLGRLFRNEISHQQQTELMIFIQPEFVTGAK